MRFKSIFFVLIFGSFCGYSYQADDSQNELNSTLDSTIQQYQSKEMTVTALGRVATFGDLYDARNEKFLGLNIFKSPVEPTLTVDTTNSKIKEAYDDTLKNKFDYMNIEAHLKVSVMSGMVDVTGAGKFLRDFQKTSKSVKATLIQSISTKKQNVQLNIKRVKEKINPEVLMGVDATHVVVGIEWGGFLFLSVEDENSDDKDVQEIFGDLKVVIKKLAVEVDGRATVNYNDSEIQHFDRYSFELYGDILTDKLPQVILDAVQVMKDSPLTLSKANDNKGKPLRYVLMDINNAREVLGQSPRDFLLQQVNEQIVEEVTKFFDKIQSVEKQVNDLHSSVRLFGNYIDENAVDQVEKLFLEFNANKIQTKMMLSDVLVRFRSKKANGEDIVNAMGGFCIPCYLEKVQNLQLLKQDISFIRNLNNLGVKVLSKHEYLQQFLWTYFNKDIYILFYDPNNIEDSFKARKPFLELLNDARKNNKDDAMFAAMDTSILRVNQNRFITLHDQNPKVTYFKHGQIVVENYHPNDKLPEELKDIMSLHEMRTQVATFQNSNAVPSGYVYIQHSGGADPTILWRGVKWRDDSYKYEGRFFRALSDQSAKFGEVQSGNAPNISLRYYYMNQEPTAFGGLVYISNFYRKMSRHEIFYNYQRDSLRAVSDEKSDGTTEWTILEVTKLKQGYSPRSYDVKIWVAE